MKIGIIITDIRITCHALNGEMAWGTVLGKRCMEHVLYSSAINARAWMILQDLRQWVNYEDND